MSDSAFRASDPDMTPPDATGRPRILVGVDGSEDALRAVQYAMGTAEYTGADIWLVHAVDDGVLTGGWGVIYDPTILAEVGQEALKQAQAFLTDRGFADERVHAEVMIGHPTAVLADLSEHAELVVLGRRASGGLERMFVGSTSVSLAASVSCPLVVISAASTPNPTGGLHRIACAVTTPNCSAASLSYAMGVAMRRQAKLHVVHVVPPEPRGLFAKAEPDKAARLSEAQTEISKVLGPLSARNPSVEVASEIRYGVPMEQLIAETGEVDLLVLGVHPHPITGVTFGGIVRGVLAHSLCPVALVRS